jgi:hypothetical protein
LWHAASNQFRARGVRVGDSLYVVSCFGGQLYLLGRLDVAYLLGPVEAADHAGEELELFDWAQDHAFAADNNIGPVYFDLIVPEATIRRMQFENGRPLAMRPGPGGQEPDPQTFRGLRQLTEASACLLDDELIAHEAP